MEYYSDPYARDLIKEGQNWEINDWRVFRNDYWNTYWSEKDYINTLMQSNDKSEKSKGYTMQMSFKAKKLEKMREFNRKQR